ncbi:nucleotidyltransferase substrate binding protein [Halochromatium glycolicum]|uniref:Nucleotidyltransferase n=1 Tax=Halochromatium glycolicum TaxID=85075 RepID=A0AAJ0U1W8_9GAMM|nr:nucleotidyltransferase substrate binding protein [Halochromatium glycolicum]MBK1703667.1 nucleotidyltransferase [Halochromatium glycolicum]
MIIDITPLEKAVARLREGLIRYQQDTADTQIRDGLIQRFEFTYELSHKLLRRWLAATAASPDAIHALTFQDLIRVGNEQGLLRGDWTAWRSYREMRARTSHTYDEDTALQVVAGIPAFLNEAEYLYGKLAERLR